MKFAVEMSVSGSSAEPEGVIAVAQALEQHGFDALAYTDHPAPSRKWMGDTPRHPTYDPFAALAFCAAVTNRIRLMTWLAVLPYRNPLLLLKCVSTVDRLSKGRFTLVAGAGYLRSEFRALGVPYDRRRARAEETLQVLRAYRREEPFAFKGEDFEAHEQVFNPSPVQSPIPIWIGGNGSAPMEWVVKYGDGWGPLLISDVRAGELGSRGIPSLDALAVQLDRLRGRLAEHGRDPLALELCVPAGDLADALAQPDEHSRRLQRMRAIGATHVMLSARGAEARDVVNAVQSYSEQIIRPMRQA